MDTVSKIFLTVSVILLTLSLSMAVARAGARVANEDWQRDMIDAGCAQHNPKTGDWEWTGQPCNPGEALREAGDE